MFGFIQDKQQRILFFAITALGISSIAVQLVVFREFLNVFHGNELVFGIILGNWFLLTGIGSYLGKYTSRIMKKIELLILSQIIIAVVPFFTVYFIRSLKIWALVPGEMANIGLIFLSSLVALLPYCIFSGMMLTLACAVFSNRRDEEQIGKVYFIDNIGDVLGGLIFSFLFVFFLASFETLFMLLLANLAAAFFLSAFVKRKLASLFIIILLVGSAGFFFSASLDEQTFQMMFPGQNILFQGSSPYGHLVVTETAGQINFFENGIPLFSTQNIMSNEETVHYVMVQHDRPEKVLLISGGVAGTTNEILKYEPEVIDYVELDPLITILGKAFTPNLKDNRIRIHQEDGRLFVKNREMKYDIAIIDLPDPSTAQINRFYSREFFAELKRILNEGAVVSLTVSSSVNYMSPETIALNAIVYNTLRTQFSNIIIIPGDNNVFVASDSGLSYEIAEMINEKGIETEYVNENYLPGKLAEQRISYVTSAIEEAGKEGEIINEDFVPLAYYYHLLFWLSHFENSIIIVIVFSVVILLIAAALLSRTSALPFAISTTAFAASGLTVVIIIGFQILFGYVYQYVGLIITAFMAGLAIGAYCMNRKIRKSGKAVMLRIEAAVALYCLAIPAVLLSMASLSGSLAVLSVVLFPLLALFLAMFVGMEFPISSKLYFRKITRKKIRTIRTKRAASDVENTAGSLYAADFIGACAGALLVSALLIPLIGIINTCLLVFIINIVSAFVVWRRA